MKHEHDSCMCGSCGSDCSGWGLLALRVVVGLFFVLHGVMKFMNLGGTSGFFGSLGIPPWFAYIVAAVEVLGGLALIVGLWTRWAGYLLALIMLGALTWAHLQWGALSWVAVVLAVIGMIMLCTSAARWGCWLLGLVVVVVLAAAFWSMVAGGISIDAAQARDMTFLAAALAIAWSGPGVWSLHSKCGCC